MEIERKNIPAMTMLESSARIKLMHICAHSSAVIPALMAEAEARGMAITGPCVFTYEGCDGKADTEFTLKVGFPVDVAKGQGAFSCMDIPARQCLSTVYRGPMSGIGPAWAAFTPAALQQGANLQSICQEVYVHWVDTDSEENLTELRMSLDG